MAVKEKIRIRLRGYDAQLVDTAAEKIVETAKRTGARVAIPVGIGAVCSSKPPGFKSDILRGNSPSDLLSSQQVGGHLPHHRISKAQSRKD